MALTAAEVEVLFTVDTDQVAKAEKQIKQVGEKVEKNPVEMTVDADAKGALAGMDRVEQAAKKLVSKDTIATVDANIERGEKSLDRVQKRLEYLKSVETELDVKADIARAEASLSKVSRNLDGLKSARAMMEVDADTSAADSAIDAVADKAADAGKEGGADAGAGLADGIVDALKTIPIAGAVVGVAFVAGKAALEAFQNGLSQEQSTDRLAALTGLHEVDAQRIGRAAGEAYANNFGDSIESNMDTARLAVQFDLIDEDATTRSAQRVIQGLGGIADALGEDVKPVATAVSTLLSTGVAKSADNAFDIIATGARVGANRNEDLLDTLTEYPALFKRLGLSGEEALGLVSQGMKAGARNSDLAADALKEFQIRATDASESSAAGFEAIGLNAEEMTAKIAAGGSGAREGLDQVLDGLRSMEDPVARNAAAVALFGTQAEDLGDALFSMDLSNAVAQLGGVEGAAKKMFDTLADNDASKMEEAKRNIEVAVTGIQGALANAFSEPLGDFAEWVSANRGPLLDFLSDLVNGALDFGDSMIVAAADGAEAFGEFVSGPLADVATGVRDMIKWFNWGADTSGLDSMIDGMRDFDDTTEDAADQIRGLRKGVDEAREKFNDFADPVIALGYVNDAARRTAEAVDEVGYAADGSGEKLEGFDRANLGASESGRLLEEQVRNTLGALGEEVEAAVAAGESQDDLKLRYENTTNALVLQLQQMGLTEGQARSLIDTVLRTPKSASTAYGSNADGERGKVQALADRITTLPDGSVVISADTSSAEWSISQLQAAFDRLRPPQSTSIGVGTVLKNHDGGVVMPMAAGGSLTPMAPIAQAVPPNTWRVVGDRMRDREFYIPDDGSARSRQILAEANRSFGIAPMADGGVVGTGARAGGVVVNVTLNIADADPDMERVARRLGREIGMELASQ